MRTLFNLYTQLKKHTPVLITEVLADYCEQGNLPEPERSGNFHYGKNSLKWFIHGLADSNISNTELFDAFYTAVSEAKALNLSEQFLSNIYKLPRTKMVYGNLKEKKKIFPKEKLKNLLVLTFGKIKVVCNDTIYNITNLIFRELRADMILARNPEEPKAAFILRSDSEIINQGIADHIQKQLSEREDSEKWVVKGEPVNLIISHNSFIEMKDMQQIIINFYKPK